VATNKEDFFKYNSLNAGFGRSFQIQFHPIAYSRLDKNLTG
jgi:hypothetical protein